MAKRGRKPKSFYENENNDNISGDENEAIEQGAKVFNDYSDKNDADIDISEDIIKNATKSIGNIGESLKDVDTNELKDKFGVDIEKDNLNEFAKKINTIKEKANKKKMIKKAEIKKDIDIDKFGIKNVDLKNILSEYLKDKVNYKNNVMNIGYSNVQITENANQIKLKWNGKMTVFDK